MYYDDHLVSVLTYSKLFLETVHVKKIRWSTGRQVDFAGWAS